MSSASKRMAWGDEDDDDYLPPRQESAVDAKGVKTVVEWAFNEAGQKTKTTTKVRAFAVHSELRALMHV
jgi:translation initiation factor 3 subunit G